MKEYKLLAHTADVRLHVRATTQEELFAAAIAGMASIIKTECATWSSADVEEVLALSSRDVTLLLIDFLSEVLTLSIIKKTVFFQASFTALTATELKAIIKGKRVSGFDEDIKAVTYHGAQVVRGPDLLYEVTITFDI